MKKVRMALCDYNAQRKTALALTINALGRFVILLSVLCAAQMYGAVQKWNLDFGGGPGPSAKTGLAASGQVSGDFWNYYTGAWLYYGPVDNLKTVDGAASDVDVIVANAPGVWGCGSSDVMYDGYIYPWYGQSA